MASPLWGFQAGQQARAQEDREAALASMALARGEQQLQAGDIELQASNLALQSQKKMLELMQQRSAQRENAAAQAPPAAGAQELYDLPDQLDDLASMAVQAGLPQQASEYASKASTIRSNAASIREKDAKQRISNLTLIANLAQSVGDEQSWNQANALYAMTTGRPSQFASLPYSPELVAKITDMVTSEKERAIRDAADARGEAARAAAKTNEARVGLINAQRDLARTRAVALEKAGAVTRQPKAEDVRAASDLILTQYPMPTEDARVLARPVAERANDIMRTDHVQRSVAVQRAFNEAKARGDFGGLRPRRAMSGTVERPIELPLDRKGNPDAAKLRPNMYYTPAAGPYKGQTLLWTGTGFKLSQPGVDNSADATTEGAEEVTSEEGFDNEHTPDVDEGL